MNEAALSWRKLVLWGLLLILGVWFLMWLFSYLTLGRVTVETSKKTDTVSVRKLSYSPSEAETIKSAQHSLSIKLSPGQYIISAGNRNLGTSKTITVKARQSSKYLINPKQIKSSTSEPVLSNGANSIAVDSSKLVYLSTQNSTGLYMIDANNKIQRLDDHLQLREASWASPDLGVLQDNNNKLYVVRGSVVAPLDLPVNIPSFESSSFSLSESGMLAFTKDRDVYAGQLGQSYKKIYRSVDPKARVSAIGSKVAIIDASQESGVSGEEDNKKIVVIDSSGRKVQKEVQNAVRINWSPSGKYLYVATEVGDYLYTSSLNRIQTIDSQTVGAITWLNDNQLAYSKGKYLWLYNVVAASAQQLGYVSGGSITLAATSSDESYIYVVAGSATDPSNSQISRFGLKNQSVPSYLQTLNIFLPEDIGVCRVGYINFVHSTITVQYPAGATLPENCVKAAKGELRNYNIDASRLQFDATPKPETQ